MEVFKKLKALSLEQALVAPYLSYRLAMDGVEVIRMEHPLHGDPNRLVGGDVMGEEGMGAYFLCVNSGKKALTLNLAEDKGKEIFASLIREMDIDIFITNQLPKNYQKLGIDYQTLKSYKEDIIWMGITGFGPDSNEAAYDPILQARSGLMEMTGEPNGGPQAIGIALPDMGTSEHGYGLIMKALYQRQATGKGSEINLSMFESSCSWQTFAFALNKTFNIKMARTGNTHQFFCPVSVFETSDGFIYLTVGNNRQWKDMVSEDIFHFLDQPKYQKNEGRIKDVEKLNKAINEVTLNHSSEFLIDFFQSLRIPVSKINTIPEVLEDPLIKRRLLSTKDPGGKLEVSLGSPPHMTDFLQSEGKQLSFPPRKGEHNHKIYGEILGYSPEKLKELKNTGVI